MARIENTNLNEGRTAYSDKILGSDGQHDLSMSKKNPVAGREAVRLLDEDLNYIQGMQTRDAIAHWFQVEENSRKK